MVQFHYRPLRIIFNGTNSICPSQRKHHLVPENCFQTTCFSKILLLFAYILKNVMLLIDPNKIITQLTQLSSTRMGPYSVSYSSPSPYTRWGSLCRNKSSLQEGHITRTNKRNCMNRGVQPHRAAQRCSLLTSWAALSPQPHCSYQHNTPFPALLFSISQPSGWLSSLLPTPPPSDWLWQLILVLSLPLEWESSCQVQGVSERTPPFLFSSHPSAQK